MNFFTAVIAYNLRNVYNLMNINFTYYSNTTVFILLVLFITSTNFYLTHYTVYDRHIHA